MLISFNSLQPSARIWIYPCNREFTDTEIAEIGPLTSQFLESWTSHNEALPAGYTVLHHRFLVIGIDESQVAAGGCSIDKSLHFIKQLEAKYKVNLTDRLLFSYRSDGKVVAVRRDEFEKRVEQGVINDDTHVFNTLVQSKAELEQKFEIPLKNSWHKSLMEI